VPIREVSTNEPRIEFERALLDRLSTETSVFGRAPSRLWLSENSAFVFVGGQRLPAWYDGDVTRFYFNVRPDSVGPVVSRVVARLRRFEIPFQIKCLRFPELYARSDAAVLYSLKRDVGHICKLIGDIWDSLATGLRSGVPLWTHPLAPGLAFAENPYSSDSFGMHRARIFAKAMVGCREARIAASSDWTTEVERAFAREGLEARRLYRGPGPQYPYDFDPFGGERLE
jgi:hypothetical protein